MRDCIKVLVSLNEITDGLVEIAGYFARGEKWATGGEFDGATLQTENPCTLCGIYRLVLAGITEWPLCEIRQFSGGYAHRSTLQNECSGLLWPLGSGVHSGLGIGDS